MGKTEGQRRAIAAARKAAAIAEAGLPVPVVAPPRVPDPVPVGRPRRYDWVAVLHNRQSAIKAAQRNLDAERFRQAYRVQELHARGVGWDEMADVLGVTRQALQKAVRALPPLNRA